MIKNEREYRITHAAAEKFRAALAAPARAKKGNAPKLRTVAREAMEAQLADLDRDLKAYEALKKGTTRLAGKLTELGPLLVQARIARNWSQQQLADRLDIHMQQIQAYEATNYDKANLRRVLDVAQVLGVVAEIKATLIELPDLASWQKMRDKGLVVVMKETLLVSDVKVPVRSAKKVGVSG